MKRERFIFILTLLIIPSFSSASVYISEVAWMGTSDNANAEWIELYNDGNETSLEGWTLEAVDGQPTIELSGTLSSGGYALLERTSDETVPSVDAYLIYTGSLANSGELLELRDEAGSIVDSVDGRDEWSVGGDNETKATLQRSGTPPTGSWKTDSPTPHGDAYVATDGAHDTGTAEDDAGSESETEKKTKQVLVGGGNVIYGKDNKTKEKHIDPALTLLIGTDKTVVKGVSTSFIARGYSESGRPITVPQVMWNFGDGSTAKGKEVKHTFWYTGKYVVSATGKRDTFIHDVQDSSKIVVTVIEPPVTVTNVTDTYVTLTNTSDETVDISGCILVSDGDHFTIPDNTYVLGETEVTFPKKITQLQTQKNVRLFDPQGTLLATHGTAVTEPKRTVASVTYTPEKVENTEEEVLAKSEEISKVAHEPTLLASVGTIDESAEHKNDSLAWWILALFTVIVTAIVAVTLVRREQQEVIEGFYIESEE